MLRCMRQFALFGLERKAKLADMKLTLQALTIAVTCGIGIAAERFENFDKDPNWDGHNNRAVRPEPRKIQQNFGYSTTSHCGGGAGEIGGLITPAAEPAYYAKEIPKRTFDDPLTASGKLVSAGRQFHVLIGF